MSAGLRSFRSWFHSVRPLSAGSIHGVFWAVAVSALSDGDVHELHRGVVVFGMRCRDLQFVGQRLGVDRVRRMFAGVLLRRSQT